MHSALALFALFESVPPQAEAGMLRTIVRQPPWRGPASGWPHRAAVVLILAAQQTEDGISTGFRAPRAELPMPLPAAPTMRYRWVTEAAGRAGVTGAGGTEKG